jgi:hypothetical protein
VKRADARGFAMDIKLIAKLSWLKRKLRKEPAAEVAPGLSGRHHGSV